MPDPRKLHSFLQRTQRAMQDAVTRGDQAGVDQYENFLDRANQVGMRFLASQGQPVSQDPQDGAPDEAQPMLVAGDQDVPPAGNSANAQPPAAAPQKTFLDLGQNREGETRNPFLTPSSSPSLTDWMPKQQKSPLDQIINGVQKAPPKPYNGPTNADTSGYVPKDQPAQSDASGGFPRMPFGDMQIYPKSDFGTKSPGLLASIGGNLQDLGESMDPSLKANLGVPYDKEYHSGVNGQLPSGTQIGPNDVSGGELSQTKISLDDAIKNTKNDPDIQAELDKLKKQLGNKPTFFTLENLAMLLLMGAPRAYGHFKSQLKDWQDRGNDIDMLGLKYKFGKAGDKVRADHWKEQEALERDKAGAHMLTEMVGGEQKMLQSQYEDKGKEIRALLQNPSYNPDKPNSAIGQRLAQLQGDQAALVEQMRAARDQAYNKKKVK